MKLFELKKIQSEFPNVKVTSSNDAYSLIKQFYGDDIEVFESFFILLLNKANSSIGYAKISQGGVSSTVADIKIISKYVIDSLASGVILCHNHPSNNLNPSDIDKKLTKNVKDIMKILSIRLFIPSSSEIKAFVCSTESSSL